MEKLYRLLSGRAMVIATLGTSGLAASFPITRWPGSTSYQAIVADVAPMVRGEHAALAIAKKSRATFFSLWLPMKTSQNRSID